MTPKRLHAGLEGLERHVRRNGIPDSGCCFVSCVGMAGCSLSAGAGQKSRTVQPFLSAAKDDIADPVEVAAKGRARQERPSHTTPSSGHRHPGRVDRHGAIPERAAPGARHADPHGGHQGLGGGDGMTGLGRRRAGHPHRTLGPVRAEVGRLASLNRYEFTVDGGADCPRAGFCGADQPDRHVLKVGQAGMPRTTATSTAAWSLASAIGSSSGNETTSSERGGDHHAPPSPASPPPRPARSRPFRPLGRLVFYPAEQRSDSASST